ncbi:S24/S26 family peptidase [Georgenia sp. MJ206]|uniref:S24/S26 family peptidase n=1 Tax=Georgenia wangjunii TaxID=3117730 RepID=UPI002F25F9F0
MTVIAVAPLALGWHGSVVQTGSMRPHIDPGDLVLLSPLPDDAPVPLGGVVEFRTPGEAERDGQSGRRLHRIVADGVKPGEWVTAGDANADVDSTAITREQISGQARLLVPWVGLPSMWIGSGTFVPLLLWLAVTIAAFVVLVWWWPERRRPVVGALGEVASGAAGGAGDAAEGPGDAPAGADDALVGAEDADGGRVTRRPAGRSASR